MDPTPHALGEYWQETLEALARFPARPEIDTLQLRTTPFATLYGVRLTSVGAYRLFGYLRVRLRPPTPISLTPSRRSEPGSGTPKTAMHPRGHTLFTVAPKLRPNGTKTRPETGSTATE
jgi:hypothetical protein